MCYDVIYVLYVLYVLYMCICVIFSLYQSRNRKYNSVDYSVFKTTINEFKILFAVL